MKRNWRRNLTIGVIPCIAIVVSGCSEPVLSDTSEKVRPAVLLTLATSTDERAITFPAVIDAVSSSEMTFKVSGQISALPVTEGQDVTKGTLVAQLDQAAFRNEVDAARTQFQGAQDEFERAERLLAGDAIAQSSFDQRKTQRDVAQTALNTAQRALNDTVLRAPFDGVISSVPASRFQNVSPSQVIAVLQTTGAAEAVVQIPSTLVAQSGRIEPISTEVTLGAAPGIRIPAEIAATSGQADPTTQTFEVRFSFVPPDDLVILPGMTGSVESKLAIRDRVGGTTDQLTVPMSAVVTDGAERYVWLVNSETMTVTKRPVTIAASIGADLTISAGLVPGDIIVGAGASYLFEGTKIRPYEE